MKDILRRYWHIPTLFIVLTWGIWYVYDLNKSRREVELQNNAIVNFYKEKPDYYVAPTSAGALVIGYQDHSKTASFITHLEQNSLKLNGRVYEIVRNGSFIDNPDLKWYNLSIPEGTINEIIQKPTVNINGNSYKFFVGLPNN
jgi:hypothetical protein